MFPAAFDYHCPGSIDDTLHLLSKLQADARLLAGGHSLIPLMKMRLAQPKHLIDLRKLSELKGIEATSDTLVIGAMTTHWEVESSRLLKEKLPLLCEIAHLIGDPQVRNRGTIGGSLAHADPAADYPCAMLALGATIVCKSSSGLRTIGIDDWFQGLLSTALGSDELLLEIRIPIPQPGTGAAYVKFPHPASRMALVGVAARVAVDEEGVCTEARFGVTGVGVSAVRAPAAEVLLVGKKGTSELIRSVADKAVTDIEIQDNLHSTVEDKAQLCRALVRRALGQALSLTGHREV